MASSNLFLYGLSWNLSGDIGLRYFEFIGDAIAFEGIVGI